MSKIVLLTEDLINKIAAGEVIERPASVVKELIENSLDAGATRMVIELEQSGKKRIKVCDNGEGMAPEDAKKSLLRHATSKIRSAEDLFNIKTLGFRGEALASIAAVSKLSLTTKQKEQLEGFNLVVEGGNIIASNISAAEQGTTIDVQNIFFNTPARNKFLKTDAVELRHCIDTVTHYALANPQTAFRLVHENAILINAPALHDQRSTIASIYGTQTAKELLEVRYEDENAIVAGYISKPYQVRNDKNQQVLFVNGRWIRNTDIVKAVYDGYHSTLFVSKHPVFVLQLRLDPERIDVNVHPQKQEIKIEQKELVLNAVSAAINKTLKENRLLPTVDINVEQQAAFGAFRNSFGDTSAKKESRPETKYLFEPSTQTMFTVNKENNGHHGQSGENRVASSESHLESYESKPAAKAVAEDKFPLLKLLGQIHKTYFVAETEGGLFHIDQHAAHERVMYEQLMKQYTDGKVQMQRLLEGELVDVSPGEKVLLLEQKEELEKLGFTIESFGGDSFAVKTIPLIFGRVRIKELLHDILALLENKNSLAQKKEEIITRMACRAAVMAGDALTVPQMEKIIADLAKTELPYTCPHGRPTIIKVTIDELEKKFRRK